MQRGEGGILFCIRGTDTTIYVGLADGALVVVGALVDGLPDGALVVGPRVVGTTVGTLVGLAVGLVVAGLAVGTAVGLDVVGPAVGLAVGLRVVGLAVGTAVGLDVVGPNVGESVVGAIRYSEKTASVTILASHWCEATARPTLYSLPIAGTDGSLWKSVHAMSPPGTG